MTPEEKEQFRQKVKSRLEGKTIEEVVDEMGKMLKEVDEGKL